MTKKKSTNPNLTRSKPRKKKIDSNPINKDHNYLNEVYNTDKNLYELGGFTPMPLQMSGLPQTQFISPQLTNNITVTPQMQADFDNATAFAANQNSNLSAWTGALGSIAPTIQMIQGGVQMSKLNDQSHVDAQLDALANTQYNDTSYTDLAAQRENNTPQVDNISLRDLEGSAKDNWKKAGSVVGAGASAGAMVGSFAGPIGTVIGAGIGAIAGGITAGIGRLTKRKKAKDKLEDYQTKNTMAIAQANDSFERSVNSRFIKDAQQDQAIYAAYGGLFNRFNDGGYAGPIYVDPDKVVQSYVSTAPTRKQRFKNRATMIGGAFADFLPSKEEVTTDIVTNKFVPKVSNKLGIVSKIVNVPDTVAKIENLKKAFNLPYSEGLIEAGKGKTLLDYTYTKNKFNNGGPKNENTDLDVSIPKDRPKSVKKNLKFLQNWANSPVTQELWKQNEIDTAAFEGQKELNRTNNKIKRLEEIIEEDKKHYGSAYKEGNSEETLELNKLRSEELTFNIDEAKNIASQKSMDEVRSDMTARLQSSFDAPLYIYEGNKEWGIENMTEKEKEDYQKLKNKVNKLYKESSKQGGLGGSDTKTKATIASYRNEDILKSNPLHEFLHPGWSGTTKTMSAPSLKMEQILREEGLYEDDYWDSGDESYSRLMDFRLLNNIGPNDREWTEERVNTELKSKGYKMLDRYGAKVISRLLNEVAYNNPSNLDIEIPEQMKYININPNDNISFAAEGGPIFREFNNGITIINEGDTHENNPHEGVQIGVDPEGTPNLVEEGEVIFNDYVFSNRLIVPNKVRNKYKLRNNKDLSFADAAKDIQKMSEEMPNDPIVKRTTELRLNQLMKEQEVVRMKKQEKRNKYSRGGKVNKFDGSNDSKITNWWETNHPYLGKYLNGISFPHNPSDINPIKTNRSSSKIVNQVFDNYVYDPNYGMDSIFINPNAKIIDKSPRKIYDVAALDENGNPIDIPLKPIRSSRSRDNKPRDNKNIGTGLMQAAPVLGSLASVINDIAGGNKPDYTNVDSYEAAINNAYKPIKAKTLNDYMEYNPYDPTYELNRLGASQAASRNALMNASNGNPSALRAAILASDYNYGNQIGDTYRKALEANDVRRQKVSEFNRGTNQFNAQAINTANQFNAQQAANKATALGQVAQWRDQIHNANRAEKSANLTGLLEGIAGLGETFMNLKDRKYLMDNKIIVGPDGKMVKVTSQGGKIKRTKNKRRLS